MWPQRQRDPVALLESFFRVLTGRKKLIEKKGYFYVKVWSHVHHCLSSRSLPKVSDQL